MRSNIIILVIATAACGGSSGTGLKKGGDVPPPPSIAKVPPAEAGKGGPPKVEVSKDARNDYQSAVQYFATQDKEGKWNESACRSSAEKFESVVRAHADLVAAQFMVGLSYHRCNMLQEAEAAYQQATRMKGDPTKQAMALSN